MTNEEAIALLSHAVHARGGTWADIGAGSGTFTRALAELLGSKGVVLAIDHDASSVRELEALSRALRVASPQSAQIQAMVGDLTTALPFRELHGIVMANVLHFVRSETQSDVLKRLAGYLQANGRIVVIEYDREEGSRWVPYPISRHVLPSVAQQAGLTEPEFVASIPSSFGGELYCAVMETPRAA